MSTRFQFRLRDILYAMLLFGIVLASVWRVRVERLRTITAERARQLAEQARQHAEKERRRSELLLIQRVKQLEDEVNRLQAAASASPSP